MSDYALSYRRDIDGLRAWAVSLVILFHAGVWPVAEGGLVGVDVFFVISGYLITRLIAGEAEQGRFSMLRFYERRVRRIIPALAAMMLATLAVSSYAMLPENLERTAESGLFAALFTSNIYFWQISTSYFETTADIEPFLHTWSLSVEEQFYIFFPPLFAFTFRRSRKALGLICVALAVVTLVVSEHANSVAPTANFFLAPTRAWEFLAGSLLALNAVAPLRSHLANTVLMASGLTLILLTSIFLAPERGFPGFNAVPPVLGAALVIYSGGAATGPVSKLLTARPVVAVGRISYSLYLYHWPVLVLAEHHLLRRALTVAETATALVLTAVLSWASFRFVEEPFRHGKRFKTPRSLFAAAGALLALAVLGSAGLKLSDGLSGLRPELAKLSLAPQLDSDARADKLAEKHCFARSVAGHGVWGCVLAEPASPGAGTVMLWGDSFAMHYMAPLVGKSELMGGKRILSFTTTTCPPVLGFDPRSLPACKQVNDAALLAVEERDVDTVILAGKWYDYVRRQEIGFADIAATVDVLRRMGRKVVLVGQSPLFPVGGPVEPYYRHLKAGGGVRATAELAMPLTFNRDLAREARADAFFDASPLFCTGKECVYHDEGGYLVRDYGHFTVEGARRVVPLLAGAVTRLAGKMPH